MTVQQFVEECVSLSDQYIQCPCVYTCVLDECIYVSICSYESVSHYAVCACRKIYKLTCCQYCRVLHVPEVHAAIQPHCQLVVLAQQLVSQISRRVRAFQLQSDLLVALQRQLTVQVLVEHSAHSGLVCAHAVDACLGLRGEHSEGLSVDIHLQLSALREGGTGPQVAASLHTKHVATVLCV